MSIFPEDTNKFEYITTIRTKKRDLSWISLWDRRCPYPQNFTFSPPASPFCSHNTQQKATDEMEVDDEEYSFVFTKPSEWTPPPIATPLWEENTSSGSMQDSTNLGFIQTDAALYSLKENIPDGQTHIYSILRMPSVLPSGNTPSLSTLNILMADCSGSMNSHWQNILKYWNTYVSPKLVGKSRIFTFDSTVKFRRSQSNLEYNDFNGGGTELTGALQTIVSEVNSSKEKFVNVFIVTDGDHNGSSINPQTVIDEMEAPALKVCSVYLLGVGGHFPVQYSIDIHSRLHNGNSNLPSLYWAKDSSNIMEQMEEIGSNVSGGASLFMELDFQGSPLPGLEQRKIFHLHELVYFKEEPEKYTELTLHFSDNSAQIKLMPQKMTTEVLFEVFRQWNSVIIQLKYKKLPIPQDVIPFMERLYKTHAQPPKHILNLSLSERLTVKDMKREEMEFRTLLNGIKSILTREKYDNQIELAESILSTVVQKTKYEEKTLQLKGHTNVEYAEDCDKFMKVYNENKDALLSLQIAPEDRCLVTKQCTLSDLQDESFPMLMKKNKFEFLKSFTVTGIPVFAPTRNSASLNPWSISVKKVLGAPYSVMSQVAMETMADASYASSSNSNKEVMADKSDENTNFNAIVPVFPPNAAKALQPIIRTRLYAMCATFSILKNPHMIDFNVHMAALGVTWVHLLYENPTLPRSEYVRIQMENIVATAACYMDRPGYANYATCLLTKTTQALMTESQESFEGKTLKCETIIKPMFFVNMIQRGERKVDLLTLTTIIRTVVLEYVGRCLSHYKSDEEESMSYTDFFGGSLEDQGKKKQLVKQFVADATSEISQSNTGLLSSFYTFEKVRKAAQSVAKEQLETMKTKLAAEIHAKVNMEKVVQLRNVTLAGDLSWTTLKTFAREVGLDEDTINQVFGEESALIYVAHALKYRSSRERLSAEVFDYPRAKEAVEREVQSENLGVLSKELYNSMVMTLENAWLQEYLDVHSEVVEPMTPQQIVHQAQQRGIQVTMETFDQVYRRYRPVYGLLGNACQTKACPYYLQPDKTYNQHSSVERMRGKTTFVHTMHQTAFKCRGEEVGVIISEMSSGKHTKDKQPIPEADVTIWKSDIKKLKNIYSEQQKGKSSNQ